MPRGGTKCPDCGYRFKERRQNDDGSIASDLVAADSRIKGYAPNDQVRAYICPGKGGKGKHLPHEVTIQRIKIDGKDHKVIVKIISKEGLELLEEFTDAWKQENIRKYRPDLVFGVTKTV